MRPWSRLFTSFAIVLALGAPRPAFALDAKELVDRHLRALGGSAKLDALKTLRLSGKITFGGDSWSIDAVFGRVTKAPGKMREEVTLQGLTAISATDGTEGWNLDPFGGRRDPERASADNLEEMRRSAETFGPIVPAVANKWPIEWLGTEDVDGTPANKLKVTRPNGDYQYAFLDPDWDLVIRVETHAFVRGSERISEVDLGSYEQVAGVWVPFSIEAGRKGGPKTERRTIERAEANLVVDDAIFKYPTDKSGGIAVVVGQKVDPAAVTVLPGSSSAPKPKEGAGEVRLDSGVLSGLRARNIGSAVMSGRVSAVAAYNQDGKTVVFVGAASGGVWKSLDGGTTFKPVFDKSAVQSIGAIAIDPQNPKNVWVGTGEAWTRNSVSYGDGIYRSTDGGESWKNVGLPNSERITKIIVHPKNGDVVYACVPGRLWSDSEERGLYKTTDGGKTWSLVLKGSNLSTGCSGVSLDPSNPEVVLAGLWDFRRKGWTFRSGGDGPTAKSGSGLFVSRDGGKTWSELAEKTNGLPAKPWGRVEVVYAPSNANIVYAFIEGVDSGLYRSDDGGKTWTARDKSQNMVWRPFYFARLVVDPTNPDRIFKPDGGLIVSEDGGKSFSSSSGGSHGDSHDLWIDPSSPKHVIMGDDGGLWISHDGGNRWWKCDNLPISQFYHVAVDDKDPYQVYGGLQDNSSWVGDTDYPGGIAYERWEVVYFGDGFWTFPDPTDPNGVYAEAQGGYIGRIDRKTRAVRDIQPKAGYGEKLRFNWNTPIHMSPNAKGTIYLGGQFLFRSKDRGDSWERISPDLTTNDPNKQKQEESGGITVDNSSAEMHTTIYSISESPKNGKLIWVGTDDGNVQVTKDGGKSWTNVVANVPGLPPASWVSWVEASRFDEKTAYAAFDRHTFGDFAPYLYRTTDLGKTWTRIAGPEQGLRGHVHVIKEDVKEKRILFAGTELGVWVSIDAGATWAELKGGDFPSVAVRDLVVHPRTGDLVLGTHGRGIWIIDDLDALRALSSKELAKSVAFLPSRPSQQRMNGVGGWVGGDAKHVGENPPGGAVVTYYQRTRHLFGPLKLEIVGPDGKVVDTISASKRRGVNRVVWSMRLPPPRVPRAAQLAFSASQGPRVIPGDYRLRLTAGKDVHESKLAIALDARGPYKLGDKKAQVDAVLKVQALFGRMSDAVDRLEGARAVIEGHQKALDPKDDLRPKLDALGTKLEDAKKKIVATKEGGAITGEERLREHADTLYGALNGWEGRPAKYQLERIEVLSKELADVEKELARTFDKDVPPVNDALEKRKLAPIPTKAPPKQQHGALEPRSSDLRRAIGAYLRGEPFEVEEERGERD